ncbi:MAG: hypothetical protein JRI91_00265 [Deltaproteobacteria bacterium]|nr:hypothetical protein [Deltaproteobacteria bacterium]
MKLFLIILTAAVTMLFPVPVYTAMDTLSDESLSSVKGNSGADDQKQPSDIAAESGTSSGGRIASQTQKISEFSFLDSKIKAVNESSDYGKFLFYFKKLEQFANAKNYNQLAGSDKFIFFCSRFAATAKNCSDKLTLPVDSNYNDTIKPVLNAKNRTFYKAGSFYNHLLNYRDGKASLPDLKKLIVEIKQNQNDFDSIYTDLKNKSKY